MEAADAPFNTSLRQLVISAHPRRSLKHNLVLSILLTHLGPRYPTINVPAQVVNTWSRPMKKRRS
jgi:hypothetical protein